jgi:hypothetical protein
MTFYTSWPPCGQQEARELMVSERGFSVSHSMRSLCDLREVTVAFAFLFC